MPNVRIFYGLYIKCTDYLRTDLIMPLASKLLKYYMKFPFRYCPECEKEGVISEWEKTKWDNRSNYKS